jgi:FixJ family two-component response regulator
MPAAPPCLFSAPNRNHAQKAQAQVSPRAISSTVPSAIAIVDDDPAVCNSLKFALELEGFAVRTYGGGAEVLRDDGDGGLADFDCFVVDQRMPAMTGLELILKLRERHIDAPAILIISQPNAALAARAARAKVPIVEKPFLGNALVDRIREACAAGGAGEP